MRGAKNQESEYIPEPCTETTVGCSGCDRYIVREYFLVVLAEAQVVRLSRIKVVTRIIRSVLLIKGGPFIMPKGKPTAYYILYGGSNDGNL